MVTKLIIVRHCQSMGNIEKRFQGQCDAPISPAGEKQLELLGLRFRNEKLDAVYSSPLSRAYRTAQAVAKYHDLPIQIADGLIEIDVGDMENLHLTEIAKAFPEVARNWDESPDLCEFPHGETMRQVYHRVNKAIDEIIAQNQGKTVFIASHGGVIRNIDARVRFGRPEGIRNGGVFGNTGVSVLEAEEDGSVRWAVMNDLSHLPEDMRRPPTRYKFHNEAV